LTQLAPPASATYFAVAICRHQIMGSEPSCGKRRTIRALVCGLGARLPPEKSTTRKELGGDGGFRRTRRVGRRLRPGGGGGAIRRARRITSRCGSRRWFRSGRGGAEGSTAELDPVGPDRADRRRGQRPVLQPASV